MRNLFLLFMGTLIVFLSGCATVPMATLEQDKKAKDFSPLPDRGSLFIFKNSIPGSDLQLISVNGRNVGSTADQSYFRFNLTPGKYGISSFASYGGSTADLDIEAGKNYFVQVHLTLFNATLEQVNEAEGRKGVLKSKLIATTVSDDELSATVRNTDNAPSVSQKLRDIQGLRSDGIITEDEYQNKKEELMKSF